MNSSNVLVSDEELKIYNFDKKYRENSEPDDQQGATKRAKHALFLSLEKMKKL